MPKRVFLKNSVMKVKRLPNFGIKASWVPKSVSMGITGEFYPNVTQKKALPQFFGNVRFVWNQFFFWLEKQYKVRKAYCKRHHINFKDMSPKKRHKVYMELPKLLQAPSESKLDSVLAKYKKKLTWLKKSDSRSLQIAIKTLVKTIHHAAEGKCREPNPKSRKCHRQAYSTDSYPVRSKNFVQSKDRVKMPKLGSCKVHWDMPIGNSTVKQATVISRPTGKYKISLSVVSDKQALLRTGQLVGIDMNLSYLAVLSTGQKYNLKHYYLAAHPKLHYWQKRSKRRHDLAKATIRNNKHYLAKHPFSPAHLKTHYYQFHNYIKARHKVAKIYRHVHNQAEDYLQKITTSIVRRFDVICMEDLKVSQMVHNHKLARAIEHAYWREFRRLIEYKCAWYNKTFIPVDKNNTTRCCWYCHTNNGKIGLGVEAWKCSNPNCPFNHKYHDRDVNAAINILMLGLGWVKPETLQPLYDYAHKESNLDLISKFNRGDHISPQRHGIIHRKEYTNK